MGEAAALTTVNPTNGETLERYTYTTEDRLDAVLESARAAQERWSVTSVEQRIAAICRLAALLTDGRQALAEQIVLEMGKPLAQALSEIDKCVLTCQYYVEHLPAMLEPRVVDVSPDSARVHLRPLGVIYAILPWNYPWWQVVRAMLPAIGAGNTVILKHADSVTGTAYTIEKTLLEAFGEQVLSTVVLSPSRVSAVIADNRIAAVTFTGSERVGAIIGQAAGAALKKCVLELGGSDPFLIIDGADVDRAAAAAVRSRFLNNGQSCIAAKRLLVHRSLRDDVVDALSGHLNALVVGDPLDPETEVGPLARFDLRDSLVDQRNRATAHGARVLASVSAPEGPGAWFSPTIMEVDGATSPLFREETFGPLGALTTFDTDDEAIRLANDTPYGLSSSIWSVDIDRAERLASRVQAGSVFINTISVSDPRLPVGGVKASGYGRELGEWGVMEFSNVQSVRVGAV